jgi:hypothetical protein
MFNSLLPRQIDNTYHGHKVALWLFGLIVTVRIIQSLVILFNGYSVVMSADGIPLDTYPPAAAQTIVAMFGLSAVSRLFILLLCVLVLVRYRSAVPFMFAFLALSYLAGQLFLQFVPTVRTGTPRGPLVNLVLFALMIIGLALSLWRRGNLQAQD